ncbi:hypothetical protein CSPX01_06281 [Colletotrichum filicis]|nr:hypothetical protein CSPX01_06281 [Colletotrichum filicis]
MGDVNLSTATGDQAQSRLAQSPANLKRPKPPSDQCGQPEAASPPQYRAVVPPLPLAQRLKGRGSESVILRPLSPTNPFPLTQHPPTTTIPPLVPITPLLLLPIPYSRGPGNQQSTGDETLHHIGPQQQLELGTGDWKPDLAGLTWIFPKHPSKLKQPQRLRRFHTLYPQILRPASCNSVPKSSDNSNLDLQFSVGNLALLNRHSQTISISQYLLAHEGLFEIHAIAHH